MSHRRYARSITTSSRIAITLVWKHTIARYWFRVDWKSQTSRPFNIPALARASSESLVKQRNPCLWSNRVIQSSLASFEIVLRSSVSKGKFSNYIIHSASKNRFGEVYVPHKNYSSTILFGRSSNNVDVQQYETSFVCSSSIITKFKLGLVDNLTSVTVCKKSSKHFRSFTGLYRNGR